MAKRGEAADSGRPGGSPRLAPGDPERVGPYQILGRLGAGGMGKVFLGRVGDGPRVAVKVLRPELAGDPAFLRMFRREVAAACRVVGFCTARVLDADISGPLPYLVTEYVEGVRLDRAVAASGRLSATDLEGLAVGMAAALTAIHGVGVVHRDLKPSNVLLSYFGPKVIDFGIARALDASVSTATGKLMGSPGWMAPEQFTQRPVGAAVDIFVWGSLVAYAGTGRRPFGQGTVVEIVHRIRHEPPDLEGLEGRLRELVEGCMAKQPEQRPTAKALLLELLGDHADPDPQASATQLLEQSWVPPVSPIQPPAVALPPAPPPPTSRPKRRVRRWLALLGLVAVAAVLVTRLDLLDLLDLLDRSPTGQPGGASVAASSRPAKAAIPARPPPLCELLGDLGVGGTLGAPSEDRGFAAAADAAGGWLPEPAALPRALGAHQFQSGCTRTWPQPAGPVVAALFQFPSRTDARAMRGQLRDALGERGVLPVRVPQVTGGELYLLEPGRGSGQLAMFACNERVLQIHVGASGSTPDPLLVRLAQGINRRLHERTGCPL
jgi:serine/threonine protein kinase